jgi:hypothetical protein
VGKSACTHRELYRERCVTLTILPFLFTSSLYGRVTLWILFVCCGCHRGYTKVTGCRKWITAIDIDPVKDGITIKAIRKFLIRFRSIHLAREVTLSHKFETLNDIYLESI